MKRRSQGPDGRTVEYRVKLQNLRSRRSAVDVDIHAYLYLPSLRRSTSNELVHLEVIGGDFVGLGPMHRKVVHLELDRASMGPLEALFPEARLDSIDDIRSVGCARF